MQRTITENALKRARVREAKNGGHLRGIVFHTWIKIKFQSLNYVIKKNY